MGRGRIPRGYRWAAAGAASALRLDLRGSVRE
jgi:hypothetical protein